MYRAYVAQKKFGVVLDEIRPSRGKEFQAIRQFAQYLSGDEGTR